MVNSLKAMEVALSLSFSGGVLVGLPLVVVLLCPRSPAYVAGLVVAVIVDAVNELFGRLWAKIFKNPGPEGAIIAKPFFVDFDAACAVVFVVLVFWIIAPLNHLIVAIILGCLSVAVSGHLLYRSLASVASAAFGRARSEVCAFRYSFVPAVTFAEPSDSIIATGACNDYELAESASSYINDCSHNNLLYSLKAVHGQAKNKGGYDNSIILRQKR
jgi:hypothetical protein